MRRHQKSVPVPLSTDEQAILDMARGGKQGSVRSDSYKSSGVGQKAFPPSKDGLGGRSMASTMIDFFSADFDDCMTISNTLIKKTQNDPLRTAFLRSFVKLRTKKNW